MQTNLKMFITLCMSFYIFCHRFISDSYNYIIKYSLKKKIPYSFLVHEMYLNGIARYCELPIVDVKFAT